MGNGGFFVKFNGTEEKVRCYAVAFHYDKWEYVVNNEEPKKFPNGVKSITIELEEGQER